jgi:hypothetical protein
MSGELTVNASVGNLSHVELYNDSTSGSWLYVYRIGLATQNQVPVLLENYQGKKATTPGVYLTDFGPVIPGGPQLAGAFGAFYSVACVGVHQLVLPGPAGGAFFDSLAPFVALPPGYACCLESDGANALLIGSFTWVVDKAP